MALSVVNNISSLTAQLALSNTTTALNSSLEKLSTGLRINSGADDPSGLVVSNEQKAQIAGLNQAITNTSNAVNLVQTGEGALSEISTLLDQARSLALDSANTGVTDATAADANQAQFTNIISTINNIANTTQFGETKLLNGSAGLQYSSTNASPTAYTISGSPANLPTANYTISNLVLATKTHVLGSAAQTYGAAGHVAVADTTIAINGTTISLAGTTTIAGVVTAINNQSSSTGVTASVDGTNGGLDLTNNAYGPGGALSVTFTSGVNYGTTTGDAYSLATDLGFVSGTQTTVGTAGVKGTNSQVETLNQDGVTGAIFGKNATIELTKQGTAINSGVLTANGNVFTVSGLTGTTAASSDFNGLVLTLGTGANNYTSAGSAADVLTVTNNSLQFQTGANAGQTASIGFGSVLASQLGTGATGVVNANFTNLNNVTLNTGASDASDAVRVIDQAIQQVSTEAGDLGAFQDYNLQANATNLQAALTNTTSAESTVTDTNFASEIANFSQLQVQEQAGASVLGVANQLPATIADLLSKL